MSDYILEMVSVKAQKVDGGRWTRMRCKSVCLGCAMVVTAVERRLDGRMLPFVAVKSVPDVLRCPTKLLQRCRFWAAANSKQSRITELEKTDIPL